MKCESYEILSGDTVTARWENGTLTVLCDALLPLFLRRTPQIDLWLETRAVDSHRANSRLLKKALRLAEKDDLSTVLFAHGATVTDNYWVRPAGSSLTYADVRFDNDYFSTLALSGTYASFNRAAGSTRTHTPELTNTGSFEKCWKLCGGKWFLYKKANHNELFSELFVCRLGKALGMNMAEYERGNGFIKTRDFTDAARVNFEPAFSFMGDNEAYDAVFKTLEKLCPQAIPDYVQMIFLDTVTANPDRHTANFGLLRDTKTGTLLGLAPNFDNNMALIARGYPAKPSRKDFLITLFCEFLHEFPDVRRFLPKIEENTVRSCIQELHMRVRTDTITEMILKRAAFIG